MTYRITEVEEAVIKALYQQPDTTMKSIAKMYGMSVTTIFKILHKGTEPTPENEDSLIIEFLHKQKIDLATLKDIVGLWNPDSHSVVRAGRIISKEVRV